jgi:hypothetical protein
VRLWEIVASSSITTFFFGACVLFWNGVPCAHKKNQEGVKNSETSIRIKSEDTPDCHRFLFTGDKSVLLVIIGTDELASGILRVLGIKFMEGISAARKVCFNLLGCLVSRMHQNSSVNT